MESNAIIESYVRDVVRRLPRHQRRDVGFELRSLLGEELDGRAEGLGRPPDESMMLDLLASFGRPQDVADRYRPAGFTVIRPADAPRFAWVALGGVAVQWAITFPAVFIPGAGADGGPATPGGSDDWLTRLSAWWLSWGLGSFWWPGFLISLTLIAAMIRHQRTKPRTNPAIIGPDTRSDTAPATFVGRDADAYEEGGTGTGFDAGIRAGSTSGPRSELDPDRVNRPGLGLAIGFWALGASALIALPWLPTLAPGLPQPFLNAFALDPDFLHQRAPWVLLLWAASFAHEFRVLVAGRTSSTTRRISLVINTCWVAALTWCLVAGPTFEAATTDGVVRACLVGMIAIIVIDLIATIRRETSPRRAPVA